MKRLEKKILKQYKSYLIDKRIIDRFTFKYLIPQIILRCGINNLDKLMKNMRKYGIKKAEQLIENNTFF